MRFPQTRCRELLRTSIWDGGVETQHFQQPPPKSYHNHYTHLPSLVGNGCTDSQSRARAQRQQLQGPAQCEDCGACWCTRLCIHTHACARVHAHTLAAQPVAITPASLHMVPATVSIPASVTPAFPQCSSSISLQIPAHGYVSAHMPSTQLTPLFYTLSVTHNTPCTHRISSIPFARRQPEHGPMLMGLTIQAPAYQSLGHPRKSRAHPLGQSDEGHHPI